MSATTGNAADPESARERRGAAVKGAPGRLLGLGLAVGTAAAIGAGTLTPVRGSLALALAVAALVLGRQAVLALPGGRAARRRTGRRSADQLAWISAAVPDVEADRRVRDMLAERSFHLELEPIHSLADHRLMAVEALLGFDGGSQRTAEVWREEAADAGLSVELDLAAIELALQTTQDLPDDVALHVHASGPTLRDPRLVQVLADAANRELVVQLTDDAVVDDYVRLERAQDRLREHGVRLAVHGTEGAGTAGLGRVISLAPAVVKLDRGLLRALREDPAQAAMAESLTGLTREAGSLLIVDGVQHEADLDAGRWLGAAAAQGSLLTREPQATGAVPGDGSPVDPHRACLVAS